MGKMLLILLAIGGGIYIVNELGWLFLFLVFIGGIIGAMLK